MRRALSVRCSCLLQGGLQERLSWMKITRHLWAGNMAQSLRGLGGPGVSPGEEGRGAEGGWRIPKPEMMDRIAT